MIPGMPRPIQSGVPGEPKKDRGPVKELRTPKQPKKPPRGTPGAGERKTGRESVQGRRYK